MPSRSPPHSRFLQDATVRHRPDRRVRTRRLPHRSRLRRCGGSPRRPACRTCFGLRSETTHCGRSPAVSAAPAQHRATGLLGPALVCARPRPEAAPPGVVLVQGRKLLRSSLPPGTREPVSPAVALYNTTHYLAAPFPEAPNPRGKFLHGQQAGLAPETLS